MPDDPGAVVDSPQPDVNAAPSAEEVPVAPLTDGVAEGSPQSPPPASADVPFHQHPRWIERQQELERERAARVALEQQNRLLMETVQRAIPQPTRPDMWAGKTDHPDAATARFWQEQKQVMEQAKQEAVAEAEARLQPLIQAGMNQLAQINVRQFRQDNPDIQPGSQEEALVIAYMEGRVDGLRHPIDSARNNAVIRRIEAENRSLKGKQTTVRAKVDANASEASSGIPSSAGLPQRPPDWRDRVRDAYRKGGDLADVANAIGMKRTTS